MFTDLMTAIMFLIIILLGCLMFSSNFSVFKRKIFIGILSFSMIVLVYAISMQMDKDGFSIFASDGLIDDQLYFLSTQMLAQQITENFSIDLSKVLNLQTETFQKPASLKSLFFSMIALPLYILAPGSGPLLFLMINVICSIIILEILSNDLQRVSSRLTSQTNYSSKLNGFSIFIVFFLMFCFLYPNFLIRMVQIEKDLLLSLIFIYVFFQLKRFYLDSEIKFPSFKYSVVVLVLFLMRPQFAIVLLLTHAYLHVFATKRSFKFFIYACCCILLFPISVLIVKIFSPTLFDLLVRMKSFSVMAGVTNFLHVDYSSYLGILRTIIVSSYYFLFAPLSTITLQGNFLWVVMMIEPILFFLLPVLVSFLLSSSMPKGRELFFTLAIATILLALFSTVFESHAGSFLRKRIPIYLLWIYLMFSCLYCKYIRLHHAKSGF